MASKPYQQTSLLNFFTKPAKSDSQVSSSPQLKENIEKIGDTVKDCQEIERENLSPARSTEKKRKRLRVVCSDDENETIEEINVENNDSFNRKKILKIVTSTPRCTEKPKSRIRANESLNDTSLNSSTLSEACDKSKTFLSSFCADDTLDSSKLELDSTVTFKHLAFEFLKPENLKDAEKRPPTHPNYDPKTLHVPESFIKSQSPGLRQWWIMKQQHYDTILLFKVGKFYELYHIDAVIAVKELNLSFMRGDYAHCGFPEIAYARFADQLVQRGFKVARVEQTETPEMMEKRLNKSSGAKEKVVKRELCRITSIGTKTYGFLDGDCDGSDAKYLYALCHMVGETASQNIFGACFVDTSVGKFYLSEFEDDSQHSKLHTMFAEFPPSQVLYPRGKMTSSVLSMLKSNYAAAMLESLTPKSQFLSSSCVLKLLANSQYFSDEKETTKNLLQIEGLKNVLSDSDPLGMTAHIDYELAVCSLGAIVWYLKECLIDFDVLSLKCFAQYSPANSNRLAKSDRLQVSNMILDGVTLKNLNVIMNADSSNNSNTEGTLLERLDTCATPSGKRLLRHWLCNPSCSINVIKNRQQAITDLLSMGDFMERSLKILKQTPDAERLLQKINTLGSKKRSEHHPDGRAILFNMNCYNKRKVNDLLAILEGFKKYAQVVNIFRNEASDNIASTLLKKCLLSEHDGGCFPNVEKILNFFETSFDVETARKEGVIIPISDGIDEDYDCAVQKVGKSEEMLNKYLSRQKSQFSCSTISFINSGRNRYIMEVPENLSSKLGNEFEFSSQRKGFKRYTSVELDKLRNALEQAENEKSEASKNVMRSIFAAFSKHLDVFRKGIDCIANADVLMGLARYAVSLGTNRCCPAVVECDSQKKPFFNVEQSVHPCSDKIHTSIDTFIPNDFSIGTEANLMLITGPNMGGKSTVMRQIGLLVVLAQIGSFVPAKTCSFTIVDRIFTRIGANDRIAAGQSTFFVELNETSAILRHATRHSLVILDELGRGTSTHDGAAIASAVVRELTAHVQCRTLFSSHYHTLVDEFAGAKNVALKHMACVVENENDDDVNEETITFLYKLVEGSCSKSHGFHAARLAGVPDEVIRRARQASKLVQIGNASVNNWRALSDTDLLRTVEKQFSRYSIHAA